MTIEAYICRDIIDDSRIGELWSRFGGETDRPLVHGTDKGSSGKHARYDGPPEELFLYRIEQLRDNEAYGRLPDDAKGSWP